MSVIDTFLTGALRLLTTQVRLKGGIAIVTLTGAVTVTDQSGNVLVLDPGGATRVVTMPVVGSCKGAMFLIHNAADAAEDLTINDAGAVLIATIVQGESYLVSSNGTVWAATPLNGRSAPGGALAADTISEITAAAGVTVDGCLIKDGRAAALATAAMFISAEVTGNGASQDTAHGFAATPSLVFAVASNLSGGACVITPGVHDATNAKFTVTTGEKYKVVAFK